MNIKKNGFNIYEMLAYLKYNETNFDDTLTAQIEKPSEKPGYKITTLWIRNSFVKDKKMFFKWVLDEEFNYVPKQINGNVMIEEIYKDLQELIDYENMLCNGKTTSDFTITVHNRKIYNETGCESFKIEYNFKNIMLSPSQKYVSSTWFSTNIPF